MKRYVYPFVIAMIAFFCNCLSPAFPQSHIPLDSILRLIQPMPLPTRSVGVDSFQGANEIIKYNFESQQMEQWPLSEPATGSSGATIGYTGDPREQTIETDSTDSFNNLVPASTMGTLTSYPISTMCKLVIGYDVNAGSPRWFSCSGTLIGCDVVVTAGHCVYDRDANEWPDEIRVYPAYNYGPSSFGVAYATDAHTYTAFMNGGPTDWDWDLGWMRLDRYMGNSTGWLGFAYYGDPNEYLNKTIHNFSYPGDFPFNGEVMYYQTGTWDFVQGPNLVYSYDPGYHGMSGSSGYYKDSNQNRYLLGILSHGENNTPTTGFVRLNQQRFTDLQNFIQTVSTSPTIAEPKTSIVIYPNPAQEMVYFSIADKAIKIKSVELMDCAGKIKLSIKDYVDLQLSLYIRNLPSGIYFAKVLTTRGVEVQKLVINQY